MTIDDAAERRAKDIIREEQRIAQLAMYAYRCGNEADIVAALRAAWTEATEAAALKCDAIAIRESGHHGNNSLKNPFCDGAKLGAEHCAAAIRGGKL